MSPLLFEPILQPRPWGGAALGQLFGSSRASSSQSQPIGESWELSDRPGAVSVVRNGPFAGASLRQLIEANPQSLLGPSAVPQTRFPWLCKLIHAAQDLSVQVHPPASAASRLGGDPKTEMWWIADALPGAIVYAGLKRGVSRQQFLNLIDSGAVDQCLHSIPVKRGDVLFLPSGRVHALGAGIVIFEIQQNSDTTYRVHDWGRLGLDGRPRQLHIHEALESIDFSDFEPTLQRPVPLSPSPSPTHRSNPPGFQSFLLVDHPDLRVEQWSLPAHSTLHLPPAASARVVSVIQGRVEVRSDDGAPPAFALPGDSCLIPPACPNPSLTALEDVLLLATPYPAQR